jgi:hypothetical protein
MPRGGRRPGAGAPKGNTNGLKTGRHSLRVKAVIDALLADPETRAVLLRLGLKGQARNVYARELALAMARLMHERPMVEAKRALVSELADITLARNTADHVAAEVATFEHRLRRDAVTGVPLTRRPLPGPSDRESQQHILQQLGLTNAISDDDNPPFTSALDGRPTPYGPRGPIDPERFARLQSEWELERYGPPEDDPFINANDAQ